MNLLRDRESLVGDKALRCIANLLILRLSEQHIKNGNIDIDNMKYYDKESYDENNKESYKESCKESN